MLLTGPTGLSDKEESISTMLHKVHNETNARLKSRLGALIETNPKICASSWGSHEYQLLVEQYSPLLQLTNIDDIEASFKENRWDNFTPTGSNSDFLAIYSDRPLKTFDGALSVLGNCKFMRDGLSEDYLVELLQFRSFQAVMGDLYENKGLLSVLQKLFYEMSQLNEEDRYTSNNVECDNNNYSQVNQFSPDKEVANSGHFNDLLGSPICLPNLKARTFAFPRTTPKKPQRNPTDSFSPIPIHPNVFIGKDTTINKDVLDTGIEPVPSVQTCAESFRCPEGLQCGSSHSQDEEEFFRKFSSSTERKTTKWKACFFGATCVLGVGQCPFAHSSEDQYCSACHSWGHLRSHGSCETTESPQIRDPSKYSTLGTFKDKETVSQKCEHQYRCFYGQECRFSHTEEELAFFRHFTAETRRKAKLEKCRNIYCGGRARCSYAHDSSDRHCANCKVWGHLRADCKEPRIA